MLRDRGGVKRLGLVVFGLDIGFALSVAARDVDIHTGCVELLFPVRGGRVLARERRPVPHPVERVWLPTGRVGWQSHVLLAP